MAAFPAATAGSLLAGPLGRSALGTLFFFATFGVPPAALPAGFLDLGTGGPSVFAAVALNKVKL